MARKVRITRRSFMTSVGTATVAPMMLGSPASAALLARSGDESKQLQACANCHGPGGNGERFAAPYLQLRNWKSGARANDAGEQMVVVARRRDDRDTAVAAYFAGIVRSSSNGTGWAHREGARDARNHCETHPLILNAYQIDAWLTQMLFRGRLSARTGARARPPGA